MIRSGTMEGGTVDANGFRLRGREVSRLEALSDAVFGFAHHAAGGVAGGAAHRGRAVRGVERLRGVRRVHGWISGRRRKQLPSVPAMG
jgi:allantoicase